jgi:hypothetical protein
MVKSAIMPGLFLVPSVSGALSGVGFGAAMAPAGMRGEGALRGLHTGRNIGLYGTIGSLGGALAGSAMGGPPGAVIGAGVGARPCQAAGVDPRAPMPRGDGHGSRRYGERHRRDRIAEFPTVIDAAYAAPGMMKMASDLVDSHSEVGGGPEAVNTLRPRARPTVWPRRRLVPGIVAPDPRGARGAECLRQRRPLPPTSARRSVLVAPARRCLCPHSGSGTTEARPPANGVTPPVPYGG